MGKLWPDGPLGWLLAPLGLLFAMVVKVRRALFRSGRRQSVRPPMPTLSIGNLAAGGTGKTPLLLETVRWLRQQQADVGVLSRGYGGDEGRLLERRFPQVTLVEGADRVAGLRQMLAGEEPPEVLLLDDGFQHLQLQRTVDVVVLDATRPFGRCFPAGLFRESKGALRHADLVVLSRADQVEEHEREAIWEQVWAASGKPLPRIEGRRAAGDRRRLHDGEVFPLEHLLGQEVHLACGIGRPDSFHRLCQELGYEVVSQQEFPDHHAWCADDLRRLQGRPLVVTEKDGVKLEGLVGEEVWELRIAWEFTRGFDAWETCLTELHLPVRAARIEPLWAAQDPDGRGVT